MPGAGDDAPATATDSTVNKSNKTAILEEFVRSQLFGVPHVHEMNDREPMTTLDANALDCSSAYSCILLCWLPG